MPRRRIRGKPVSKRLDPFQKKFLQYILKHHKGIGCSETISYMLSSDSYDSINITKILKKWQRMVKGNVRFIQKYGTPKKYRKLT